MDELQFHGQEAERVAKERLRESLQGVRKGWIFLVVFATLSAAILNGVWGLVTRLKSVPPLETEIQTSLKQLQDDSNRTLTLITKLQKEISERKDSVQQAEQELNTLRQQKTALELTNEQKHAIQSLVKQQPSTKEFFTPKDFWLGKVLVSTFCMIIGLVAGRWMRRFDKQPTGPK